MDFLSFEQIIAIKSPQIRFVGSCLSFCQRAEGPKKECFFLVHGGTVPKQRLQYGHIFSIPIEIAVYKVPHLYRYECTVVSSSEKSILCRIAAPCHRFRLVGPGEETKKLEPNNVCAPHSHTCTAESGHKRTTTFCKRENRIKTGAKLPSK